MNTFTSTNPLMPIASLSQNQGTSPVATWRDADELRWATRHWASRMDVPLSSLHLRPMKLKWASISTRGRLTMNLEVLELPRELGEFVIVHELVHLLAPNHGRVFKAFLSAYLPDWAEREARLRALEKARLEHKQCKTAKKKPRIARCTVGNS